MEQNKKLEDRLKHLEEMINYLEEKFIKIKEEIDNMINKTIFIEG